MGYLPELGIATLGSNMLYCSVTSSFDDVICPVYLVMLCLRAFLVPPYIPDVVYSAVERNPRLSVVAETID